jgi:hypothetical protein
LAVLVRAPAIAAQERQQHDGEGVEQQEAAHQQRPLVDMIFEPTDEAPSSSWRFSQTLVCGHT